MSTPVGWRWRLPSDTQWQFTDGPEEPRLGLPTSFEAAAIKEPVFAARSAPEAGKAVDFADGIPFDLVEKVENRIAYRISLGSTPRAIAEDVLQLASASPQPVAPTGEIAGLVRSRKSLDPKGTPKLCRKWMDEAAAALTASEAEAADLRRKLEEHQDAEDKAAREMATVIQGLRNRATAAERKLEEARKALESAHNLIANTAFDAGEPHDWAVAVDEQIQSALAIPAAPLSEDTHHG